MGAHALGRHGSFLTSSFKARCADALAWAPIAAVVVLAAVSALRTHDAGTSRPAKPNHCKVVYGPFTSVVVPDPAPPAVLATRGLLEGKLDGTYDFRAFTLVPDDPAAPTQLTYEGESVITTKRGDLLFGEDTGVLHLLPDGTADFVSIVHIVGGTGKYAGASGEIVATGVLDFVSGEAVGSYEGEICKRELR